MSPKPFHLPRLARTPWGRYWQKYHVRKIKAKRIAPPFSMKRFENRMRSIAEQLKAIHDGQIGEQQNWSDWMQKLDILRKDPSFEINRRYILQVIREREETARETDIELLRTEEKIVAINLWMEANNPPENQKKQLTRRMFQAIQILREFQKRQAGWEKTLATHAAKLAAKDN